jgi:hypothetical protein
MKNRRNYYRILQVQPDAPAEIIRASYHTLMKELKQHPDFGGSTPHASLLNEAYGTLSDPTRRAAYDQETLARLSKKSGINSNSGKPSLSTLLCPFCRRPLARKARAGESCPTCQIPLRSSKPADLDRTSRRSIARLKRHGRIVYSSSWPEEPREGKMIDLSPKGMRFLCSERLRPGTVLKIGNPLLKASVIVTNLHDEEVEGIFSYAVGVSFLAVEFEEPKGSFLSVSA